MRPTAIGIAITTSFLLLGTGVALADAVQLQSAAAGATSSWEGDSAVLSTGAIGYRLDDQVALQLIGMGGYAGVGHRVLTAAGVGVQLRSRGRRARPYVRAAVLRATEQPFENLADDPLGGLLGTSEGVHHRAGAMGAAGVEVALARTRALTLFLSAEVSLTGFRDHGPPPSDVRPLVLPDAANGPRAYLGLAIGLGVEFDLVRLRRLANPS